MGTTTSSGYVTSDGLDIYYEIHGGPPDGARAPFVLLPGGAMTIETAFADDLLPLLSRQRPVIAMEMQGHGHTGDRNGAITLDQMARDASAVLTHLQVARAHFIGHSLGALVSFGVAISHPEQVASITAVGATYTFDDMLPELVKLQRDPTHEPSAALIPLLPTADDFAAWTDSFRRSAPDPDAFEDILGKLNVMLAQWPGWPEAKIAALSAPVLLAIGDNDFVRIDRAAEAARLIPDAQLAVLPGTTHMSITRRGAWLFPLIEARIAGG
ncbi:alpha/beta fold hydrolase [Phenylobacterium sp.]|uniref:alpha/beta fold hydrolase n=1 Tax=Phenylobacterium sp. TaxID=1871053 RepID=UPI00273043E3|nr:alpha/beta fold hydrolase [Phenylobacterium sp.]MDP1598925.1 alpha/beta fold hydrolase [Phenylobacterium sp.]MDP3594897.1 alpha/beta fold hydrolase [Phenylobacterium sp.]